MSILFSIFFTILCVSLPLSYFMSVVIAIHQVPWIDDVSCFHSIVCLANSYSLFLLFKGYHAASKSRRCFQNLELLPKTVQPIESKFNQPKKYRLVKVEEGNTFLGRWHNWNGQRSRNNPWWQMKLRSNFRIYGFISSFSV